MENQCYNAKLIFDRRYDFTFYCSLFFTSNAIALREENDFFTLKSLLPNKVRSL